MIKSKYLIIISLIITITLCVIGFSYSFYVAGITGNEEASSLIATTGYLRLVYTDTMYVRGDKITPGWTQTKTFTVENTGDYLAQYDLIWETLNNTLINKDTLTYTITSNNGGGNIQNVVIPDSGSDLSIVNDIKIYPGVIQTYTAVFRYENASFDQSSDMDKVFNGKLAIRSNKLVYDYNYTGDVQIFTSPKTAKYKIQLWGAQGGGGFGYGGYTEGEILLKSGTQLFVYVGQYPEYATGSCYATNPNTSFNGNSTGTCASGGGATDIRLIGGKWHDLTSLKSRIMVSGAGGGTIYGGSGGPAGGLISYDGIGTEGAAGYSVGIGVNQTTGASFGIPSRSTTSGGGGYYGGNGAFGGNSAGGSSYISGHTGCVAIASNQTTDPKTGCLTGTADNSCSVHYSTYYFTNTKMIDGKGYSWTNEIGNIEQMPNPSGGLFDSGTGNTGNGHARITYLEDVSASDYNNDHLILLYDGL